jgi:response regulator of citrate/malate metabolism
MDGEIDPRTVEAMERFSKYSKDAKDQMQALQQQMDKFTSSMAMTKQHTKDLAESFRTIGTAQPFQQMEAPAGPAAQALSAASPASNITVNLNIDVSGVTDKTDKRALAREIGAMVTKELRTKMGGSLTQSGFNRSG